MKMQRNFKKDVVTKLKMVTTSGSIKGMMYIEAMIYKIKLIKELFIYELECGFECIIPKELSQDTFPFSFRYYDPIIAIV